jgi:3-oxoacyl-[acyl-carrier protein] reductase
MAAAQYDLAGRVAVVTGGARGIGFAAAERLLDSGASVVLWDVLAERLSEAKAKLVARGRVAAKVVDITDESAVFAAAAGVNAEFGRADILVNSAGITGPNHPLWEYPAADFWRVQSVNLMGTFHCCKALKPLLKKSPAGRIVNLSSIAGKDGTPNASAYSASKAAVIAFTKSLGKELAETTVRVNCVTPAAANTEMLGQMTPEHVRIMLAKSPMNRFVEADEIAAMILWLCSDECSFSTGAVFDISGGRAVY